MRPINKMAAMVTQESSVDDRFQMKSHDKKFNVMFWKNPRKGVFTPVGTPLFDNLTGVKFGRLTVFNYLGRGKWQCRCVCGNYCSRKSKAVKNPKNDHDACEECRELAFLKREHNWRITGKDQDVKDFY